ncbi:MAG: exosome complex RNA-binding protein Csl4 [Candidatus Micrarchaeota archaeon]
MDKKNTFIGQTIASCEEYVPGKNAFGEADQIYSAVIGKSQTDGQSISVIPEGKKIIDVAVGSFVYGLIAEIRDTKAIVDCIMAEEYPNSRFSMPSFGSSLPVQNIRINSYVKTVRDELKIGDIIKAKVVATSPAILISIAEPSLGVMVAFCSACRNSMSLKNDFATCNNCEKTEKRKTITG